MKIPRAKLENVTKNTYLQYLRLFPVLQKKRTREYSMLVLTFGTMTFFALFAINPTLTTIAELNRTLKDVRFVEKELGTKITNLGQLQNQYVQLENDIPLILQTIPDMPLAPRLLGQLQTIIRQSGVQLQSLSTSDIPIYSLPPIANGTVTFDLQVSGTYAQVSQLLKTLSAFNRIVVIDSIAITKQSVTDPAMSVGISATAYFER